MYPYSFAWVHVLRNVGTGEWEFVNGLVMEPGNVKQF